MKIVKIFLPLVLILLFGVTVYGCTDNSENTHKTFIMEEGVVHFSLEYPSKYKIDSNKPAETEGNRFEKSTYFSLDGPLNQQVNDYVNILIAVAPPDDLIHDAEGAIERAEKQAAKWDGYELFGKSEIEVSGYQGYRIDYRMVNIVPVIAGDSEEPRYSVYRDVRFDAKGYVWMIQISSDSSTAEEDKEDFEHILKTFKVLE